MSRANSSSVKIIVDVHERQSGIAGTLCELGADVEIASLPAGDYAVGADTLVERKRVLDLHAAVLKGRLWPQLGKLRAACAFPYLLVEGTDIDRGPLHHNAVRGACLAVIDQGSRSSAAVTSGTQLSGFTGWQFAARRSNPQRTDRHTRSDLDRRRGTKRRRRCSPPSPASRRPRPARYSNGSGAWLV
jgi:ERCC4-type nuclease